MDEKFKGSNIIKLFIYFILFLLIIFFSKLTIKILYDESINLLKKFEGIVTFFVLLVLPFIFLAVKSSKYYILLGKDYIEINGLTKKRTIRFQDICAITESRNPSFFGALEKAAGKVSGINVTYNYGEKKKKASIYIGASTKGFKRIYQHLLDSCPRASSIG